MASVPRSPPSSLLLQSDLTASVDADAQNLAWQRCYVKSLALDLAEREARAHFAVAKVHGLVAH